VARLVSAVAAEGRLIRSEEIEWSRGDLRRRLRRSWSPNRAEIVAIEGGRVIGHLGVTREGHRSTRHVASLGMAVAADRRGRGVGTALLATAFDWARWAGVEKLSLEVYPDNTRALRLYRAFGFMYEGRLRGHSKKSTGYQDELVMGAWV
jgi:RimJ/RimL family protein N-acetyltransferase